MKNEHQQEQIEAPEPVEEAQPHNAVAEKKEPPAWTTVYPAEDRPYLASWGDDPKTYTRAHEANLRLIEFGKASSIAGPGLCAGPFLGRIYLKHIFLATASDPGQLLHGNLGVYRDPGDYEVGPNWLAAYPSEYAPVLMSHGVPTAGGGQVDDYNRALIVLVEPDAPPEKRDEAADDAFLRAFGYNLLRQLADEDADEQARIEAIYSGTALEDMALLDYPEHRRELIRLLGRPDFEHPRASDYNRALIGGAMCLEELGKGDPESLKVLQACLWPAFFSDPCPG